MKIIMVGFADPRHDLSAMPIGVAVSHCERSSAENMKIQNTIRTRKTTTATRRN